MPNMSFQNILEKLLAKVAIIQVPTTGEEFDRLREFMNWLEPQFEEDTEPIGQIFWSLFDIAERAEEQLGYAV